MSWPDAGKLDPLELAELRLVVEREQKCAVIVQLAQRDAADATRDRTALMVLLSRRYGCCDGDTIDASTGVITRAGSKDRSSPVALSPAATGDGKG